jgi:hypothetical protein
MELQSREIDPRSIRELGFRRIQSRLTFRKFMDNRIVDATVWFGFNELMPVQTKGVFRCKPIRTDGHQSPIRVEKDGDRPTNYRFWSCRQQCFYRIFILKIVVSNNQVSAALWLDTIFQATGIRVSMSLRLRLAGVRVSESPPSLSLQGSAPVQ